MKALIFGGTRFIGRHIVETLLEAGHSVSILNRGISRDELPAEVERLRGDRDEGVPGLKSLAGRSWDVCIDVSGYTARQVRPSAEMLRERVNRYVFISAVSVYGDPQDRPVCESHPRLAPAAEEVTKVDGDTYGPLKVTCENIVQQVYADRSALLRPQIVVGPLDERRRYQYWAQRALEGGQMLAPGDGSDHLQFIDVRDVASFARTVIENDLSGPFNLAGPRFTWAEFMVLLEARDIVWVSGDILKSSQVTEFQLPLFRPERGPRSGLMDVSNLRAREAGLTLTDPDITLRDLRASMAGKKLRPMLSRKREAELIRISRAPGSAERPT